MPTIQRAHPMIVAGPHRLLHGGDYNPEQWRHRPEILEEDARLMAEAGVNQASVGIFSWAALEPARGRYDFGWLDGVMDRLAGAGVGVLLATPLAARPRWLAEAHPEVMCMRADGRREQPGSGRHNACTSSPALRERGGAVIDRLAERYAAHPALLGWHIDNEYGERSICHCELCIGRFQDWLRERYQGDLDRLNRAWWTSFWSHQYQSWEQIRPGDASMEALQLNWRRFASDQLIDYNRFQIRAVRARSALPVTTNFHGWLDHYDHGRMAKDLDFTSYDSYPQIDGTAQDRQALLDQSWFGAAVRGFGGGRPWLLMESCPAQPQYHRLMRAKRPGVHRLLSMAMVAEGSDGVCYFQWRAGMGGAEKFHGAVLMHDAPPRTRVFAEVAGLGRELAGLGDLAGADPGARVAVLWDVESEWARRLNSGMLTLPRPVELSRAWYTTWSDAGHNVDVVDAETDLTRYRVVVVPGVFLLRPGFAGRLEAAARAGAQVVVDAMSAWVDADMSVPSGGRFGPLAGLLGLRGEEFDQLRTDERIPLDDPAGWLPAGTAGMAWIDGVRADGAEVLVACTGGGFHQGWPFLTRRALGAGRVWYLAGELDAGARCHFAGRLAAEAGIAPILPGLPAGVLVRERVQPDRRFVVMMNPGQEAATVPLEAGWSDAAAGTDLAGPLVLPPSDVRILVRPA